MSETTVSQASPLPLTTRLEYWISIARHKGYGTMTGSDWKSLESVLVLSLARIKRGPVSDEAQANMVAAQRARRAREAQNDH